MEVKLEDIEWNLEEDDEVDDTVSYRRPPVMPVLKNLKALRHRLGAKLGDFAGFRVETVLRDLTETACKILELHNSLAVMDTFAAYSEEVLDQELTRLLSWQLAGNHDKLGRGIFVPRCDNQPVEEWALARITNSCDREITGWRKVPGFVLEFFVHTGHIAGRHFVREYQLGYAPVVARRFKLPRRGTRGFSREDLVGLYSYLRLRPYDRSWRAQHYTRSYAPASLQQLNRSLLKNRLDPKQCPYSLKPEYYQRCNDCHHGYAGAEACAYAMWPKTVEPSKTLEE